MHDGLQTIVTPKTTMANLIVRAVRAHDHRPGSEILTLYKMVDNRVEALEFQIGENAGITNIPNLKIRIFHATAFYGVCGTKERYSFNRRNGLHR